MNVRHYLLIFMAMGLILASCKEGTTPVVEDPKIQIIYETSYQSLQNTFNNHNYHLDRLDAGVPPLIVEKMPEDLDAINNIDARKRLFFKIMLPLILLVNDEIRLERQQLLAIQEHLSSSGSLEPEQTATLTALAERYRVDLSAQELEQAIEVLLRRVDVIPVDLALAQAANESAWGTSRFTQTANNLFGQWTFKPGLGVVPQERPEGAVYEVRKFPTIYDSVRSYANNLNAHHAYQPFRSLRAEKAGERVSPDGFSLAEGLLSYSIRGEDYIQEIQTMIRFNDLQRLATADLRKE